MEYIFYGQTTPAFQSIRFTIKDPPLRLSVESSIGSFNYTLLLNLTNDIIVTVVSETEIKDIDTLLDIVKGLTQSFYDTAFLNSGILSEVIFTSLYLPNKSLCQINNHNISGWLHSNIFDFETEKLFQLKNTQVVKIAIADIKYACLEHDLTAFFSFRAIEGIMNSFTESDKDDRKNSWLILRESLNISRDFFSKVEALSKSNRHGKEFEQSFEDRQICIYSAMIVLQRYLHFLDEGKQKLNPEKYPILKSIEDFGIKLFHKNLL